MTLMVATPLSAYKCQETPEDTDKLTRLLAGEFQIDNLNRSGRISRSIKWVSLTAHATKLGLKPRVVIRVTAAATLLSKEVEERMTLARSTKKSGLCLGRLTFQKICCRPHTSDC